MHSPLAIFDFSFSSLLVLGVLAVLLFGERLPDVARSVGKWFVEFKTQVHGFQREIHSAIDAADSPLPTSVAQNEPPEDRETATAPKFEPPPPQ